MIFIKKIIYWLRLFREAFGNYKWQIIILTLIGFLSGLLEGIGANALIPLFSFITGEGSGSDFISQTIERAFLFFNVDFAIGALLIFIAVLFIAKAIFSFFGSYIQIKISSDYEKNLRSELFKKTLQSQWRYLLEQKIGYLEKILSTEVTQVTRILLTISSFILIITNLIVFLFVAINISFSITMLTFSTGIIVVVVFQPLVKMIKRITQEVAAKTRSVAHFINENVLGMKTLKVASVNDFVASLGDSHFETLRKLQMKRSIVGNIFGSFFQPFGVVFILTLFSFWYKSGTFNLPAFIAMVYLIQRIFAQVQNLQTNTQTFFGMLPYLEHVLAYRRTALENEEENSGGRGFVFEKTFSFKNITFNYNHNTKILDDISFSVPKGSFVGLIGPSGAGKTTIVDIALRLFKPNSGDVLLDGVSASEINLHDYRRNVGYVSQDIHLINDTIANNIRFFDETITDEHIKYAARQANIYDVAQSLPKKFDSMVGERGVHFSAGQRQRIVIARVLARKPQLLILDEATSALDNESELAIQNAIENLKGKITVLVIAHRLQTVMNCDRILVLESGKIVEEGKPKELLKDKHTHFHKAYNIRQ